MPMKIVDAVYPNQVSIKNVKYSFFFEMEAEPASELIDVYGFLLFYLTKV
jgi:hypothetical protein